jgi:translation initiation factor IF-1
METGGLLAGAGGRGKPGAFLQLNAGAALTMNRRARQMARHKYDMAQGGFRRGGGGGRRGNRNAPRPRKLGPDGEEKSVEVEGTITSVLAGTQFRVQLQSGHEVLAHISGKMRKRFIRLVVGDRVKMEMSPYDVSKARITFRLG